MLQIRRFLHEEEAATAVEYAVMLAMILLVCLSAIVVVGQNAAELWGNNETGLQSAFSP